VTATIIKLTYSSQDVQNRELSLLENIFPYNAYPLLEDYIIDGGDFDIGQGYGIDTDAGNFDTGTIQAITYSYEAGNFDTGEEVFYPSPPVIDPLSAIDGGIDYKDPNRYYLINLENEPVYENELPRNSYLLSPVLKPEFSVAMNHGFAFEIKKLERLFEGFDYGSENRRSGYNVDYGTVPTSSTDDFDFNSITNYQPPYPPSYIV